MNEHSPGNDAPKVAPPAYVHRLIVGTTLSGKTVTAKKLVEAHARQGIIATVHDPLMSEWPGDAIVLPTKEEFFAVMDKRMAAKQVQLCVTDEADTVWDMGNKPEFWRVLRGRHYGVAHIFISQRPQLIAPTVRTQAHELFCFRVSANDAATLAQDFADERIRAATDLQMGEFLYSRWVDGKKTIDKMRAF